MFPICITISLSLSLSLVTFELMQELFHGLQHYAVFDKHTPLYLFVSFVVWCTFPVVSVDFMTAPGPAFIFPTLPLRYDDPLVCLPLSIRVDNQQCHDLLNTLASQSWDRVPTGPYGLVVM